MSKQRWCQCWLLWLGSSGRSVNGVVDAFEAADSGSGIDVASYLADDASTWPVWREWLGWMVDMVWSGLVQKPPSSLFGSMYRLLKI